MRLNDLLKEAKAAEISALVGKPIEIVFNAGRMESWRLLTEVL